MAIANSDGSIILSTKIDTSGVSKAIDSLKRKIDSVKEKKAAIQQLTQAIKDQQYVIKQLEIEYGILVSKGKGNSAQAESLRTRITALRSELNQLNGAANAFGVETAAASNKAAAGFAKFGKRIAGIVKSALVFSVIYRVLQSVVKLLNNILMSNDEFQRDWEELRAAFYTAAYPIINLIVPAIQWIVQQVRDWAVSIGKVAAALQGMSYSELVDQAKASKEAADNYADMEKSSKKTADNVKKQLASFDDIQVLSSGKDEEQGSTPSGFESLKEYDASGAKSMLGDVMEAIGGALMAVGVILLFHGQIAWGIGFIIAGAIGITAATLSDESVSQKVKDELSNALLIAGAVAIVLGILLCMAQQWGFGIGLIILGVASIVAPVALNWDGIKQQLQGPLGGWLVIGGIVAIVLGILLCFTPMLPLGIGLIVLGAASVVAPVVANWDAITERLHNFFAENAGLITGASIGLIVLGILLCFTPMIGLGIGLIVAGVGGLAGVVAVNWNAIVDWVKGAVDAVVNWVQTYGMLVLGILLVLTGVGIGYGIKIIWDWLSSSAESGNETSRAIVDWVKGVWGAIEGFWNAHIAPVFTAQFWLDLAKNCANGLIGGFEAAINGIIAMFERMINWIVDGINSIGFDIPDWLGGGRFGFNIPRASFGRVSIPRLAQGAVIPPNREFLAVLGDQRRGTNIETPLSTMVEAFQMALDSRGGYGGGNTEVVLEVDGREFGRAVVEQSNRENRRIGTRLVIA